MLQVGNTHESKGRRLEVSESEDFLKSFFSKSEDLQRVICYRSSL